jgi:hypothetical protein
MVGGILESSSVVLKDERSIQINGSDTAKEAKAMSSHLRLRIKLPAAGRDMASCKDLVPVLKRLLGSSGDRSVFPARAAQPELDQRNQDGHGEEQNRDGRGIADTTVLEGRVPDEIDDRLGRP